MLRVASLWKRYDHADGPVDALKDVSLDVADGAFVTITGPSGVREDDAPPGGGRPPAPVVGAHPLPRPAAPRPRATPALAAFRRDHVGFVMQNFSLIPYLTALGNVMLPLGLQGVARGEQPERATAALDEVGLAAAGNHLPRELSAGQQQRVAIARATVTRPALVLADEPTGNLDPALARDILAVLRGLNRDRGMTIVMVTHSPEAAAMGSVRFHMASGGITAEDDAVRERASPAATVRD